jgi:hypothetical protein
MPAYCAALHVMAEGVEVDWPYVNARIVSRWSLYALTWIKQRAWAQYDLEVGAIEEEEKP